jgi:predicted phage terminase large subunit-like protein
MGETEREQIELAAHAALARRDFLGYATFTDPTYQVSRHIQKLAGYLDAVERGEIRRLAIVMPPRHSKSESTSGKFPAYCLGRDSTRCVMITSYAATLAETFSIQNRDTISSSERYQTVFPDVALNPNVRGREKWALAGRRESCIAAGVGGSITGLGAWLLLIDDPVKNYEEAVSAARQEAIYNWYTTTARTRLTPDGAVIIIMTRWAEGDLLGRILGTEDGSEFTYLHLPALSYGTVEDYIQVYPNEEERSKKIATLPEAAFPDPLQRPLGAPLWPERYTTEFLHKQKILLGHDFESLYQGNPGAPEGTKFKRDWFRPITQPVLDQLKLTMVDQVRSYDLAWSAKTTSDYTVGTRATLYKVHTQPPNVAIPDADVKNYLERVAIPPVMIVIEDEVRWQKEWDLSIEEIIRVALKDKHGYELLVEAIASQNIGIKSLKKDLRLWKHKMRGITTTRDKVARSNYALKLGGRGLLFILYPTLSRAPLWEKDWLDELAAFPNGAHDDRVDTLTQLVNHWQPRIDELLRHMPVGEWYTPFMRGGQEQGRSHLPSEFQQNRNAQYQYARDTLGWAT